MLNSGQREGKAYLLNVERVIFSKVKLLQGVADTLLGVIWKLTHQCDVTFKSK